MVQQAPANYKVYITPLWQRDQYVDPEIAAERRYDVTDAVLDTGVSKIKQSIDSGDYEVGIFNYGNINLKLQNFYAKFNEPDDWRSLFTWSRDLAKVEIEFTDETGATQTRFFGLIANEATKLDIIKEIITFKVLSRDSVLRKTNVKGGFISAGMDFKTAIETVLNQPKITSVLNFNAADVNPQYNGIIDDATPFDGRSSKDVLDKLLIAANSVLEINVAGDMVVRSRAANNNSPWGLYGQGDVFGRENIIDIKNYNSGLQRTINSVIVNDRLSENADLIDRFNLAQREFDFEFITSVATAEDIGQQYIDEFGIPKEEMEVVIPMRAGKDMQLLDKVTVEYDNRRRPFREEKLPVWGANQWGQFRYPYSFGTFTVPENHLWKIISIEENVKKLETTLKLRRAGRNWHDGVI